MSLIGATIEDTALTPRRRGVIVAEGPPVLVSWRRGMVTAVTSADLLAGRYVVIGYDPHHP